MSAVDLLIIVHEGGFRRPSLPFLHDHYHWRLKTLETHELGLFTAHDYQYGLLACPIQMIPIIPLLPTEPQ